MHSVELLLEIMSFDLRMGSVILMLSSLSHLRRVVAMPNRKGVNVAAIFAETPSEWSGYVWSISGFTKVLAFEFDIQGFVVVIIKKEFVVGMLDLDGSLNLDGRLDLDGKLNLDVRLDLNV